MPGCGVAGQRAQRADWPAAGVPAASCPHLPGHGAGHHTWPPAWQPAGFKGPPFPCVGHRTSPGLGLAFFQRPMMRSGSAPADLPSGPSPVKRLSRPSARVRMGAARRPPSRRESVLWVFDARPLPDSRPAHLPSRPELVCLLAFRRRVVFSHRLVVLWVGLLGPGLSFQGNPR